jgi:transcriptional antiterminator Rof (Rho-off)
VSEAKRWHSRGYLPHFDAAGTIQGVTCRLYDALPLETLERWRVELGFRDTLSAEDPAATELRRRIARYEDAGHGA